MNHTTRIEGSAIAQNSFFTFGTFGRPRARGAIVSRIAATLLAASAVCAAGCAATPDASAPSAQRDLTRSDAIASARDDARRSYGTEWGSHVDARYSAGFWVIDLYAPSGYRLRYAISARDGSIRQRNMLQ